MKRWLREHGLDGPGRPPVYLAYFGTASPAHCQICATRLECSPDQLDSLVPLTEGVYCISATCLQRVYEPVRGPWRDEYEVAYRRLFPTVDRLLTADPKTRAQVINVHRVFWDNVLRSYDSLRLARLYAFLRERKPDDNIGYSILVYRLTARDIQEALWGGWWH